MGASTSAACAGRRRRDVCVRWLADGRLHRVHHGVYAVGTWPLDLGDYLAAVLACGDGAVLSHRAAAHLLRLLRGAPPPPEVTRPDARRPPASGHRRPSRPLAALPATTSTCDGIPITTVPRALLDLAPPCGRQSSLERATRRGSHHRTTADARRGLHRAQPAPARRARSCAAPSVADVTLSELEAASCAAARTTACRRPRTNIAHARRRGRLPLAAVRLHRRAADATASMLAPRVRGTTSPAADARTTLALPLRRRHSDRCA